MKNKRDHKTFDGFTYKGDVITASSNVDRNQWNDKYLYPFFYKTLHEPNSP